MLNFNQQLNTSDKAQHASKFTFIYRRQLILLFAALALTFYAAQWAANPQHWQWLVTLEQKQQPETLTKLDIEEPIANINQRPGEIDPLTPSGNNPDKLPLANEKIDASKNQYLDIDDSSTGLLRRELPAYYQMLMAASELTLSDWEPLGLTQAGFSQLLQSPSAFRGQKFKLIGDARMIHQIKEPANNLGIEETYEIWLQTRDSGKDLFRIRCTKLPKGLTLGVQQTHLEIYGLFFKRQNYASNNGNRTSPMLVSARVEIPKSAAGPINVLKIEFFLLGTCFLLATTALLYWHYIHDRKFETEVIQKLKELTPAEQLALEQFSLPADEPLDIDIKITR